MSHALTEFSVAVHIAPSVIPLLENPRTLEVAIQQVVATLLLEAKRTGEVSIMLTDDATITALNRDYRGVAQATDVLSFGYGDAAAFPPPIEQEVGITDLMPLGDLVVSVETAQRQAGLNGHDLTTELLMLVAHGTLHLLGYSDETEAERLAMNRHAVRVLNALGYPAKEVWASRYDETEHGTC